jgi:hypothetical protein
MTTKTEEEKIWEKGWEKGFNDGFSRALEVFSYILEKGNIEDIFEEIYRGKFRK